MYIALKNRYFNIIFGIEQFCIAYSSRKLTMDLVFKIEFHVKKKLCWEKESARTINFFHKFVILKSLFIFIGNLGCQKNSILVQILWTWPLKKIIFKILNCTMCKIIFKWSYKWCFNFYYCRWLAIHIQCWLVQQLCTQIRLF